MSSDGTIMPCDICNKQFPSKVQMVEHRRTHIQQGQGEDPEIREAFGESVEVAEQIYCQYCEKGFTDFEVWKLHEEEESRQFSHQNNSLVKQEVDASNVKMEFIQNAPYPFTNFTNGTIYSQLENGANLPSDQVGSYSIAGGQMLQNNYVQQDSQGYPNQFSINGFATPGNIVYSQMGQEVYSGMNPQFGVNYSVPMPEMANPGMENVKEIKEEVVNDAANESSIVYEQNVNEYPGVARNLGGNYARQEIGYPQFPILEKNVNSYEGITVTGGKAPTMGIAENTGANKEESIKLELREEVNTLESENSFNLGLGEHSTSVNDSENELDNSLSKKSSRKAFSRETTNFLLEYLSKKLVVSRLKALRELFLDDELSNSFSESFRKVECSPKPKLK